MRVLFTLVCATALAGCGPPPDTSKAGTPPPAEPTATTGHSHEKGTMMLADAGPYHALLTAHLSKDGHKLDLYFETTGRTPQPVALPLASIKASVQVRAGEGAVKEIEFVPAPPAERPAGEAAGACSHFVATVPWLNPDAVHRVIIRAPIDGEDEEVRWNDFRPRKYARHTD